MSFSPLLFIVDCKMTAPLLLAARGVALRVVNIAARNKAMIVRDFMMYSLVVVVSASVLIFSSQKFVELSSGCGQRSQTDSERAVGSLNEMDCTRFEPTKDDPYGNLGNGGGLFGCDHEGIARCALGTKLR
jgi:hypothetical protein